MPTRDERKKQLEAMMRSYQGQDQIIALYQQKVVRPGDEERPGMHVGGMIPLILEKEYPESVAGQK